MPSRVDVEVARIVGAEVRRRRVAQRWSLRRLGAVAGLNFSFLRKIENGEGASLASYVSIAHALEAPLGVLFAAADGRSVRRPPRPAPGNATQGKRQRHSDRGHARMVRAKGRRREATQAD